MTAITKRNPKASSEINITYKAINHFDRINIVKRIKLSDWSPYKDNV